MGIFSKIFGSKKTDQPEAKKNPAVSVHSQQMDYELPANGKGPAEKVPDTMLVRIFADYFSPNRDFYSIPGSDKFNAYFNVVNAARDELFSQPELLMASTKWGSLDLIKLVKDPKPGITNAMICGLIFLMGHYAVIKDAVYCVDFSERIPNCVGLYMLLIAQKQPADRRMQIIDAGDGTDKKPLSDVMESLRVCDPQWDFKIA